MVNNKPIEDLDINSSNYPRVTNVLRREGVNDALTLANMTEDRLLGLRNLGPKDVVRIKQALDELGLELKS